MNSECPREYHQGCELNPSSTKYHEFLFLFSGFTLIALHLKGDIGGILGIIILPFVYLSRCEFKIEKRIYRIFLLFILYMIFFTIVSVNKTLSFKADIELLRSLALFFVGWIFCKRLEDTKLVWLMSLVLLVSVFGNFFFPKNFWYLNGNEPEFFSYHNGPNKSGFMYAFYCLISGILFLFSKNKIEKLINVFTLCACLYLIVLVNCRSVWLGLAISSLFFVWFNAKIVKPLKYILISTISFVSILITIFFNAKGISLSHRNIIWNALIGNTIENHPFLGYGIDLSEHLLKIIKMENIAAFSHNSIVEIFISSGFLGTVFFVGIVYCLFKALILKHVSSNPIYIVGVCGLICFIIISFFDFKFFTFRFFGTIYVFLAFCQYGISKQIEA